MSERKHPMQDIVMESDDVVRFRANKIIGWLMATGKIDLNEIAALAQHDLFDADDQMQLAQLLGYSVSGFGDLSYAADDVVAEADAKADALIATLTPKD